MASLSQKGGTLTLSKRGRKYQAAFASPVLSKPIYTQMVTQLQANGRPGFAVGKDGDTGQTSALIDEFRIERVK